MSDMQEMNKRIMEEFRANGGFVGGIFEGAPMLILHSIGAKSGKPRVNPLMYQALGNDFAIFASNAGAPNNPLWYNNLEKNPEASVEVATDTVKVSARIAHGEEREEIWTRQKADFPMFTSYEQQTDRQIPVILLERA